MPHVRFDPSSIVLDDFTQDGSGYYYYGLPYQRGYGHRGAGIGSIFRHLIRFLMPIAKGAGKTVGKEALVTSARILDNIAQGAELKDTLITEAKEGVKRLAKRQTGGGAKRRKVTKPKKSAPKKKKKKKATRKSIQGRRVMLPKSRLGFF